MKKGTIPTIAYARVVGYYRPIGAFNEGRAAEMKNRNLITSCAGC